MCNAELMFSVSTVGLWDVVCMLSECCTGMQGMLGVEGKKRTKEPNKERKKKEKK
jgi:hypothetical protein